MKFNFYIPYQIKDFCYKIKCFFFPRNKWLTKAIPREYKDKDSLIQTVLFKCLTEYVETEMGKEELFDPNRWKEDKSFGESYNEAMKFQVKFEEELKDVYLIATKTIPNLEKELESAWEKVPKFDFANPNRDYHKTYGEIDRIEKELSEIKMSVMLWIVRNSGSMWT